MKKLILLFVLFIGISNIYAQKEVRQNIKAGNKQYEKEKYIDAEIDYRKSLEANPNSADAAFNLGNALFKQEKYDDALKQYMTAMQNGTDDLSISQALHNIGNALLSKQDFQKAIDAYKQSLRLNPNDDETRYNLAFAQKQQKDQEDQQQNQDENQDQDQNKDHPIRNETLENLVCSVTTLMM